MWTNEEIITATKGALQGSAFEAMSVTIDSRKAEQGGLFIALKGDRADGHDYLKEAFARGAAAALVHRIPEGFSGHASVIVVDDTYKALVDLAVAARARTKAKIIGITGSVGKTGTKEALRMALASAGKVYATQGNLNNHIGLPLSLANLPRDAKFGVFELGMNHAGEISFLSRIVRPDIAVITNVEAVHLEFFSNVEAIADAKAEIMEGMAENGVIILNRDNRFYNRLHDQALAHGLKHIVSFGAHTEAQCRLISYALVDFASQIEAMIYGTPVTYRLGTVGGHWAMTSLAAIAVVVAAGADLADAAASLEHFHEPDGRGRLHRIKNGKGTLTLIDDCYNASPVSMQAGIAKLAELHAGMDSGARKIVVLGDMLELGIASVDLHKSLQPVLEQYHVDKLYAAGPLMKHLYDALPAAMQGAYEKNAALLAEVLRKELQPGDIVLIKGSRGSRMDMVRDALMATPHIVKETADAV